MGALVYHGWLYSRLSALILTCVVMVPVVRFFLDPLSTRLRAWIGDSVPEEHHVVAPGLRHSGLRALEAALIVFLIVFVHEIVADEIGELMTALPAGVSTQFGFEYAKAQLALSSVGAAMTGIGTVTLSWIMLSRWSRITAALLSGIAGAVVTGLSLMLFSEISGSLRTVLAAAPAPAHAFIIGNAALVGCIAVAGCLVIKRELPLRVSRAFSALLVVIALVAALLFSSRFSAFYGDTLIPRTFFLAYPFVAIGWAAALLICPPYFDEQLPSVETRESGDTGS